MAILHVMIEQCLITCMHTKYCKGRCTTYVVCVAFQNAQAISGAGIPDAARCTTTRNHQPISSGAALDRARMAGQGLEALAGGGVPNAAGLVRRCSGQAPPRVEPAAGVDPLLVALQFHQALAGDSVPDLSNAVFAADGELGAVLAPCTAQHLGGGNGVAGFIAGLAYRNHTVSKQQRIM